MHLRSIRIMLSVNVEQRANVKFLVKLGKTSTETYDLLRIVYRDDSLFCTQVFEWFKKFKERRKRLKTIPVLVVLAHRKQTVTLKKFNFYVQPPRFTNTHFHNIFLKVFDLLDSLKKNFFVEIIRLIFLW